VLGLDSVGRAARSGTVVPRSPVVGGDRGGSAAGLGVQFDLPVRRAASVGEAPSWPTWPATLRRMLTNAGLEPLAKPLAAFTRLSL
jgi:hypothetical protein